MNFKEFRNIYEVFDPDESTNKAYAVFKLLDVDKSFSLSKEEFRKVIMMEDRNDAKFYWKMFVKDKEKGMSLDEFTNLLLYSELNLINS